MELNFLFPDANEKNNELQPKKLEMKKGRNVKFEVKTHFNN